MKVNRNNSKNNTDKTSPDIRNNALFIDITAEEEMFVRGGRPKMPGIMVG